MALFTYKILDGIFVTTDIEPDEWIEKYSVSEEQELLIRAGANLEVIEDGSLIIHPIIGDDIKLESEPEPEPEPEPEI